MGFGTSTIAAFASTTGFTSGMVYQWATTTIDVYSAAVLGTVVYFNPYVISGIMILAIVGFSFIALRAFTL